MDLSIDPTRVLAAANDLRDAPLVGGYTVALRPPADTGSGTLDAWLADTAACTKAFHAGLDAEIRRLARIVEAVARATQEVDSRPWR